MRILFVGFTNSIHTARWVGQLTDLGWDLHVFSSNGREVHPSFREVTVHSLLRKPPFSPPARQRLRDLVRLGHHPSVRQRGLWFPFSFGGGLEVRLEKVVPHRARHLARTIRRIRPDVIHTHELNQSGKLTLAARDLLDGRFPPWVVTCWGNDLWLYGRMPEEAENLRRILGACDYYQGESRRDAALARRFGFTGEVLPDLPVGGGFDLSAFAGDRPPPSARRVIALKGYQGELGRALVALRALRRCADLLDGYTLALYSAAPEVALAARLLAQDTGLRLEVVEQRSSHADLVAVQGRARLSVGLAISDGVPASVLEAMGMGAFPVQSNTGTADEWLIDGETGLLVPPEDPEVVEQALRRALTDDALVDGAAVRNAEVVRARLDQRVIRPQVVATYERIAARARGRA